MGKSTLLLPWLTANPSGYSDKRFVQVGNSLFLHKQFQVLKDSSRWLYLCLADESGGQRSVRFTHSVAEKYGFNRNTFDSCIKELISVKLIERVEDDERAQFAANVFRFTPERFKNLTQEEVERLAGRKRIKKKKRDAPNLQK